MYTYLLIVNVSGNIEDGEEDKIDIYSSYEKAKEEGLKFLTRKLNCYSSEVNKTIADCIKEGALYYEFKIIEKDVSYAEKFDKKIEIFDKIEKLLIYEPTEKEYLLDYKGKVKDIVLEYKSKNNHLLAQNHLYMKPNDLKKEAGTKFKVGDLVKIVKPSITGGDLAYCYYPEYSKVYVVRFLPRRVEGQKYLRNTYLLSEIKDEDFAPGIYTWEFHEEQLKKYEGKIKENSPIDVLRKIILGEIKVDKDTWHKLKNGIISFRDKDKDKNNYYKKVLNLKGKNYEK